jgi:dihydropteroate synthase
MFASKFKKNKTLNFGGKLICLNAPCVMGILNLTPDSFYAESRFSSDAPLLKKAEKMLAEGAFFLDLGAVSTRPNAEEVSEEEEMQRLLPAIKILKKNFPDIIFSADTFRKNVAQAAYDEGVLMINDVSGEESDDELAFFCAQKKLPYIIMHARGNSKTMNNLTEYTDIVSDLMLFFSQKLAIYRENNLNDVIIDPGFGFAKTLAQNYFLLNHLDTFAALQQPILVGISRKSMIYKALETTPDEALNGTTVLNTMALMRGADILRVHDVKEAIETVKLFKLCTAAH